MGVRDILSEWCFARSLLRCVRFWLYRYVLQRRFRNYYLQDRLTLNGVQNGTGLCTFFGYYNITSHNRSDGILYNEVHDGAIIGNRDAPLNIRLFNVATNEDRRLASSYCWNWQQGCMLQWYKGGDGHVIYNNYSPYAQQYTSELLDTRTGETRVFDTPIYSVSPDGKFALSLNFSRLARCRPDYGYFNKRCSDEELYSLNDGISRVDFEENITTRILSLEDIGRFGDVPDGPGTTHWVNHIDISPDGNRFMFLHRWKRRGSRERFSRLLTADVDGTAMCCLADDEMVSHCCWRNPVQILSYCRKEPNGVGYYLLTDQTEQFEKLNNENLTVDGHPSFSPDGEWIVTDTYPDKARFARLILYNVKENRTVLLGEFYQPLRYRKEHRCDLHPRFDMTGNYLSFDSAHTGKRRYHFLDIRPITEEPFRA